MKNVENSVEESQQSQVTTQWSTKRVKNIVIQAIFLALFCIRSKTNYVMRKMIVILREMCEEIRVPDIGLILLLLC